MKRISKICVLMWLVLAASLAQAQIATTGQIVGTIQDQSGSVIPGVELQLQNENTKAIQTATASADGGFVFPTVAPGSYTLTVTKQGFETTAYKGIIVNAARTTNQTVILKIGAVTQTVEVQGEASVLHTTATTVSGTVDQKYLQDLPLTGRSVLPFALLSAGAQQGVTSRDSTFNGLPGASINITLNGIANNAQRFKSGGTSFFAFVAPRLEAVQEVTIATSNLGANSTGQGAIQIQFVSKSGTNAWHGEVFWQHENSALNANNWFNNARRIKRPVFIRNDQGGAIGGPIIRNKLFFFLSYAHVKTPQSVDFETRVLTPAAQTGIFSYVGTDGAARSVNLLQLAGQNGFPSTVNPIIGAQLQKIQSSTSAGSLSVFDSIRNRLRWVAPSPVTNQFPSARIDYQPTEKLRLSFSDTYNRNVNDKGFRGTVLPGVFTTEQSVGQISNPYIANAGATWTLRPNMVNEFNFGIQSNQEIFNIGYDRSLFQPRLLNFPLTLPSGLEVTNGLGFGITFQPRNNPIYNLANNFYYQRGNHSFSFGGNYIRSIVHQGTLGDAGTPRFSFGVVGNDPVNAIFSATNFPNITTDARNDALALYALLTGRVSNVAKSVNVDERSKQFVEDQPVTIRERQTSFGLYLQDSWRASRSLTLNYGLRWDFQGENFNTNDIYTSPTLLDLFGPSGLALGGDDNSPNLFNPGSLPGIANPSIYQRSHAYRRDYLNPGPHLGLAWNPSFQNGLLGRLFGDRQTVFRGGYSVSYYSEGLLNFTNNAGNNPGLRQSGNLVPGVDFAPGSLRLGDPLPTFNLFPRSFSFPLALSNFAFSNTAISTIDQNIRAPYVQTWSASIQRELKQGSVIEVRYVGNRGVRLWHTFNLNEVNIFENGFLNQFQNAQRNLSAFRAANPQCGQAGQPLCSFANGGLTGQTAIPIFQSAFAGLTAAQGFSNATFLSLLDSGQAGALANTISSTSTYFCRLVGNGFGPCAGLGFNTPGQYPINLFRLNPFLGNANVLSDNSFSNYNALQIEFRQRLSHGLTMNVNYAISHAMNDRYNKNVDNAGNFATLRNRRLDYGPSTFDIRHVLQAFGTYDLPVGQGRKFSLKNPILDGAIGGWTVGAIFRIQSGLPFKLSSGRMTVNQSDAGVILNGVTASDLQKMVGVFKSSGPDVLFVDPKLIGGDLRASGSFLSAPTTPGQFGAFVYLYGPKFVTTDLSLAKAMPLIKEKLRMEIRAEMVNAFNHPIFEVPTGGTFGVTPVSITATNFGRTTTATSVPRQVQFRVRFTF
ncbi:MAG TPA: carboxypeptidase regulatory-like domain-containing protein [Blastocatellia bacterium]|nr:carboxypeptidase regulatory-like domain-containing protein [Blastocatellia bacterium]